MPANLEYFRQKTIAALVTAVGGPVAIIRMSGADSFLILNKLIKKSDVESHRARVAKFYSPRSGEVLDECLWIGFRGPNSFTGEDVVEIQCHGNPIVVKSLIDAIHDLGAEPAIAGEFSFRAVRNGKMSLNQAQAVAELIGAKNQIATSIALNKLGGALNALVEKLGDDLRTALSLAELGIDFSDQDIDEVAMPQLRSRVEAVIDVLENLAASFDRGTKIQEGVKLALVGLPNSGKSSLFNAILGQDRSIVTDIAGTTRDVVRETINLKNVTFRISDTAGIRDTNNRVEKIGVQLALGEVESADLVLWILESNRPIDDEIKQLSERLGKYFEKICVVFTKSDLLSEGSSETVNELRDWVKSLGLAPAIETSSADLRGVSELCNEMIAKVSQKVAWTPGEIILTQIDQKQAVMESLSHLRRGLEAPAPELLAADIQQAVAALRILIGTTHVDDILGRIFSKFCIGK